MHLVWGHKPNVCNIHHRVWAINGPEQDDKASRLAATPKRGDKLDGILPYHFHNNNVGHNLWQCYVGEEQLHMKVKG